MSKCPGMDPANWKIEDISELKCIHCGNPLEFWKDDVKRVCPECGKTMFNPNIGNLCLVWCKKAAECLGNQDIVEWKEKFCNDK
jgi:predicted RNA-binding Zn-ribbon protein involved in translation (DUF1610 family)